MIHRQNNFFLSLENWQYNLLRQGERTKHLFLKILKRLYTGAIPLFSNQSKEDNLKFLNKICLLEFFSKITHFKTIKGKEKKVKFDFKKKEK